MNDFEWRRQMRELRQPQMPRRDLWHNIESALTDQTASLSEVASRAKRPSRNRWSLLTAVAAGLLLAGVSLDWQWQRQPPAIARISVANVRWKPADPRLAGAAIELQAARMELQQALEQAPDSPALRRLLVRTERQQTALRQRTRQAS